MTSLGPITSVLEDELKRELRQRNLVIWLDKDGHYTPYVDQLAERHSQGDFFAPVISFRGSYLNMLLALEPYGNGEIPDLLLIHMPGHTEDTIRQTPILELYRAGYRYRRALDTLIRESALGKINPDDIESYLGKGVSDLDTAEKWLEKNLSHSQDDLSYYLDSLSLEWILDGLLGAEQTLKSRFSNQDALPYLAEHLYRHTGLDQAFISFYLQAENYSFVDLGETFAAWLMSVEYVHDLTRSPHTDALKPLQALSAPLKKNCDRLIQYFRQRHPDLYASTASIVEIRLDEELSQMRPRDLGKIDTFKGEETTVFEEGALKALAASDWDKALTWAETRLGNHSFWIQRDRTRRTEWTLIRDAAILGSTIQRVGSLLKPNQNLRDALEAYTQIGYEVDQVHRHLEQQYSKLLETSQPHFNELQKTGNELRRLYRNWADHLAETFAKICENEGFLPETELQQRYLYDQVVHPLTQSDAKVAYFLIDAFRYEMAAELLPELKGAGIQANLKGRYAELPSITAVGMNVLAPVSKVGRLTLAGTKGFNGFKTGEYTVKKPTDRARAMGDRSVECDSAGRRRMVSLNLSDVCEKTTDSLKRSCAKGDLIIVHSKEIDDAGEANVGIVTFERWIQQLKSAWNHLKTIGINEFVFTADHGFLLQDQTTQNIPYGKKTDPSRRHVLVAEQRKEAKTVTVSLNELGYEGQAGYLLFPRNTAVFDTGKSSASFVHGGNSLQERIVPILTVSHRYKSNAKLTKYQIEAQPKSSLLGCSRIQVRVRPVSHAQGVLSFTGAKYINLALRVPNRRDLEVEIKDAPGSVLKNQQVQLSVDQDWTEILFDLQGAHDERVRIEIYHPDVAEDVEPALIETFFEVAGKAQSDSKQFVEGDHSTDWQDSFEDYSITQVFQHLQQHGSITEIELINLLGNARKVRRFALNFETHVQKVPFLVRVETTGTGKRYVKDLER